MEIKAKLQKPYTEKDRLDFIVTQNHQHGYEIKETEEALEAWGLTEEEIAKKQRDERINELKGKLKEIDEKSARSMRAVLADTATDEDRAYLAQLETQAAAYRAEIKQLQELNK